MAATAAAAAPVQQVSLVSCKHCNRSFTGEALARHESVCQSGTLKNRQKFDSHRQRVQGDTMHHSDNSQHLNFVYSTSVGTGFSRHGSTILVGSGRVGSGHGDGVIFEQL